MIRSKGSTGDPGGYKGESRESRYAISDEQWREFRLRAWGVFQEAFQQGDGPISYLAETHF